jgi:hypothetical protein
VAEADGTAYWSRGGRVWIRIGKLTIRKVILPYKNKKFSNWRNKNMSCEEMEREWEQVEEEIVEIIPILDNPPPMAVILEEVHTESHILIDFEKMRLGKPNLKKAEMSGLLLRAGEIVKARLLEKSKVPAKHFLAKTLVDSG